jgi:hypothetical protein
MEVVILTTNSAATVNGSVSSPQYPFGNRFDGSCWRSR